MLDSGLIKEQEFNDLSAHNYRRLKLVDVFGSHSEHQFLSEHDNVLCKLCGDANVDTQLEQPQLTILEIVKEPSLESSDNGNR